MKKNVSLNLTRLLLMLLTSLISGVVHSQPYWHVEHKSMNIGADDFKPYNYAPGNTPGENVQAEIDLIDVNNDPGNSDFFVEVIEGDLVDPEDESKGWLNFFVKFDFHAKPNPPTASPENYLDNFEVIKHGLGVFGITGGHFRGNVIGDSYFSVYRTDDPNTPQDEEGYLYLNKNNFPEDDPNTPYNEESYMPYVSGGTEIITRTWGTLNGEPVIITLPGVYNNEAKTGPNVGKTDLPAGSIVVHIDQTFANPADIRVQYEFKRICAYQISIDRDMITAVQRVNDSPLFPGSYIIEDHPLISYKFGRFKRQWHRNKCNGLSIALQEWQYNMYLNPWYGNLYINDQGYYPPYRVTLTKADDPYATTSTTVATNYFPKMALNIENNEEYYVRVARYDQGYWIDGDLGYVSFKSSGSMMKMKNEMESKVSVIDLNIYPNPSRSRGFSLNLVGLKEELNTISIAIYDLLGKQVYNTHLDSFGPDEIIGINKSNELSKGSYILRVSVNGEDFVRRVQIN